VTGTALQVSLNAGLPAADIATHAVSSAAVLRPIITRCSDFQAQPSLRPDYGWASGEIKMREAAASARARPLRSQNWVSTLTVT
jgi:hypothetical protein